MSGPPIIYTTGSVAGSASRQVTCTGTGSVLTGEDTPRQHRGRWGWDACRGHGRDGRPLVLLMRACVHQCTRAFADALRLPLCVAGCQCVYEKVEGAMQVVSYAKAFPSENPPRCVCFVSATLCGRVGCPRLHPAAGGYTRLSQRSDSTPPGGHDDPFALHFTVQASFRQPTQYLQMGNAATITGAPGAFFGVWPQAICSA